MSEECPIRFIITVEALSEGWDCPFAYVLATVANKQSKTNVEQIVGRVLRQPYAVRAKTRALNVSYVLTSSADFNETIDQVVAGLNGAGFSKTTSWQAKRQRNPTMSGTSRTNWPTLMMVIPKRMPAMSMTT